MIIAFETKETEQLNTFLHDLKNPPNPSIAMLQASSYAQNDIDRIGDLIVLRQKFVFDSFFKIGIVTGLGLMLLSLFISTSWLLMTGLLIVIFNASLISPLVRFLAIRLKLFTRGHKGKMSMVTSAYVVEKMFQERDSKIEDV